MSVRIVTSSSSVCVTGDISPLDKAMRDAMETYLACYRDATFVCSVCGDTVYPKISVNEQGIFINSVRSELRGGLSNKPLKKNVCNRCVSASKELTK